MVDMRRDDRSEPVAVRLDPRRRRRFDRCRRERLVEPVCRRPFLAKLDRGVRTEQLQLGEDAVIADWNDVEGHFVNRLRVEMERRQRLRRREEGGRKEPAPGIVKELEGGEEVGEQEGAATAA